MYWNSMLDANFEIRVCPPNLWSLMLDLTEDVNRVGWKHKCKMNMHSYERCICHLKTYISLVQLALPISNNFHLRRTIYTWQCLLSKHERKWFNSKATNESLMHIEHLNFIFHEFLKLLCTCMAYLEPNLFYINIGLLA